jgi:hypothetical protein
MINEIKTLNWNQTLGVIFVFLGTISPGFLIIYLFKPELISSLDSIKIILFSLSISLPIVVVNMSVCIFGSFDEEENSKFVGAILALFLTAAALYPSILISYIYGFSFKDFLKTVLVIQIFLILFVFVDNKLEKRKKST